MAGDVHCMWSWVFCLHIVKYLRLAAALEVEVKCYVNASLEHLGLCYPWVLPPKCLSLALYRPAPFTAELLILLQTSGMGHNDSCVSSGSVLQSLVSFLNPATEVKRLHHCSSLSLLKRNVSVPALGTLVKCLKMCRETSPKAHNPEGNTGTKEFI